VKFGGILGNREPDLPLNLSAKELDIPLVASTKRGKCRAIAISGTGEVSLGLRKLQKRAPV
jgi:hypothetical protein